MDPEKLDSFCQIYKDNAILDKYSLIDIMLDLQIKTNDLQGIMFNSFSSSSTRSTNYDDLIYTTIYGLTYDKGADIEYIDKWLKEFEIDIDDIVKNNLGSNEIGKYISVKHNDFHGTQEDKRKAHLIQVEFLDYFLKFYAGNFQSKIYSGFDVTYKNEWKYIKLSGVDVECLNNFCMSIFDESLATKNSNRTNIRDLANKLEIEIIENIISIDPSKVDTYLERVLKALEERQNDITFSTDQMDTWVSEFHIDLDEFPNFKNEELNIILNIKYSGKHVSVDERKHIFQIHTDFYYYACTIEVEKMIGYLKSKMMKISNSSTENIEENTTAKIKWSGKPSQLGFIVGNLAELGYIEVPRRPNGNINYSQFGKIVKNTFDVVGTEDSLSKYLNLDCDKSQETKKKFESNGFEIPNKISVS